MPMPDDGRPVVGVLGAIGPDKGARRLERLVALTRERSLGLRWVLIGYLDRGREPWQSDDGVFTMHGPYDSGELAALLEHYRVRLVAYPSAGPETFSFTLSEAWATGLPAIVPPIGALAERVAASGGGWILTEEEWHSEAQMLERIAGVLDHRHRDKYDAAAARARDAPQPSLDAMLASTLEIYRRVSDPSSKSAMPPIPAQRCLEALHYTPWHPPAQAQRRVPAAANGAAGSWGAVSRIAHAALRIRHTLPGRVLYRLAPRSLLDALKARLGP